MKYLCLGILFFCFKMSHASPFIEIEGSHDTVYVDSAKLVFIERIVITGDLEASCFEEVYYLRVKEGYDLHAFSWLIMNRWGEVEWESKTEKSWGTYTKSIHGEILKHGIYYTKIDYQVRKDNQLIISKFNDSLTVLR